jgi:hypothetical protein
MKRLKIIVLSRDPRIDTMSCAACARTRAREIIEEFSLEKAPTRITRTASIALPVGDVG